MSGNRSRGAGSIYLDPIYMSFVALTQEVLRHIDDREIFDSVEEWEPLDEEHMNLFTGVSEFDQVLSRHKTYVHFVTERLAKANPVPESSSKLVLVQASWEQVLRNLRKFTEQMELITPGRVLAMKLVDELVDEIRFTEQQAQKLLPSEPRKFFAELVELRDAVLQEEDELKALTELLRFIENFQRGETYAYMTKQWAIALRESEETPPVDRLMDQLEAYCLQLELV